jgi:hypothetical protein
MRMPRCETGQFFGVGTSTRVEFGVLRSLLVFRREGVLRDAVPSMVVGWSLERSLLIVSRPRTIGASATAPGGPVL